MEEARSRPLTHVAVPAYRSGSFPGPRSGRGKAQLPARQHTEPDGGGTESI